MVPVVAFVQVEHLRVTVLLLPGRCMLLINVVIQAACHRDDVTVLAVTIVWQFSSAPFK